MAKNGPILIIEHDEDDQHILDKAFKELGITNQLLFFEESEKVIPFLMTTEERPFLIIADVHIPGIDGVALRRKINEVDLLKSKSIPFIFFTTTAKAKEVDDAYKNMVQGYFEKDDKFEKMKASLKTIVDYWLLAKHPNGG
jgi:DNA-binding NtrC family response regulator